jgi:hypothetical protein
MRAWDGVPKFQERMHAVNMEEAAMRKHLPDLFEEQPADLLHNLVSVSLLTDGYSHIIVNC